MDPACHFLFLSVRVTHNFAFVSADVPVQEELPLSYALA